MRIAAVALLATGCSTAGSHSAKPDAAAPFARLKQLDSTIPFVFDGGTTIDPDHDGPMHGARVRVNGPKSARAEWTCFEGGKPNHTAEFVLTRGSRARRAKVERVGPRGAGRVPSPPRPMPKKAALTLSGILLLVLGFLFGPEVLTGSGDSASSSTTAGAGISERADAPAAQSKAPSSSTAGSSARADVAIDTRIGFTSKRALEEHHAKHGREFGSITQAEYLRLAQELRDAARGGPVRESTRDDGVITRFDTRSGAFIAFHDDKTIRTFFKPNDGLRYFERQLDKDH